MKKFDCIVIGGGHAGIEAALAISRMGQSVLMVTFQKDTIGLMSCNPAIGGVGKGQLVKEVDALGGFMARAADITGIQFRMLNASKGPAVQSSRAQIDMDVYKKYAQKVIGQTKNLSVLEGEVKRLIVGDGSVQGVVTEKDEEIAAQCVVICTGTFLDGLIHVGLESHSGGRFHEAASIGLGSQLKELGLRILRFKTGTCPRLDKKTIDYSGLIPQEGDNPPLPFSSFSDTVTHDQVSCYLTYTNIKTHQIIRDNLNRSPLYAGFIQSTGVRYCPSIEDKIVKFADKERHQVFLEPQGLDTDEIYPNGLSTSLPEDVQLSMVRSIAGLENARIIRFGYGIEHSVVEPTQIFPTLETKLIKNLFLAGQINGTTGYEEAAAQGLVAGINAALKVKKMKPLILDRASSYIGVLIDDLTTKGTNEPYRMFTSRVEYRLIVREDNADLRLGKIGHDLGLLSKDDFEIIKEKSIGMKKGLAHLKSVRIKPTDEVNALLATIGSAAIHRTVTCDELLRRPQVSIQDLRQLGCLKDSILDSAWRQVEIEVKYAGFIQRQLKDVERFEHLEKIRLPDDMDYSIIASLSREISEKLARFKPLNLGQASRISGVTPVSISLLMIYLKKLHGIKNKKG